jgi:hypothetical protein
MTARAFLSQRRRTRFDSWARDSFFLAACIPNCIILAILCTTFYSRHAARYILLGAVSTTAVACKLCGTNAISGQWAMSARQVPILIGVPQQRPGHGNRGQCSKSHATTASQICLPASLVSRRGGIALADHRCKTAGHGPTFVQSVLIGLNPWRTMDGTLPRRYSSPKMAVTSP